MTFHVNHLLGQMIHMKSQTFFSLEKKIKERYFKVSSAVVVISTSRVNFTWNRLILRIIYNSRKCIFTIISVVSFKFNWCFSKHRSVSVSIV